MMICIMIIYLLIIIIIICIHFFRIIFLFCPTFTIPLISSLNKRTTMLLIFFEVLFLITMQFFDMLGWFCHSTILNSIVCVRSYVRTYINSTILLWIFKKTIMNTYDYTYVSTLSITVRTYKMSRKEISFEFLVIFLIPMVTSSFQKTYPH